MSRTPSRGQLELQYLRNKKSAFEISRVFNCSEHKINYWIRKYGIQKRSISDAMYARHNPKGDPFKVKEAKTLKDAKLHGLGLGLYWGEGNKKNKNAVRLGNTNPRLIKKFIEFLVKVLGVDVKRLKFGLQIFSDMSESNILKYWLGELSKFKISRRQFFKVTVTPSRSIGNYREKSKYGVLTVNFCNTKLKKILDNMLPL